MCMRFRTLVLFGLAACIAVLAWQLLFVPVSSVSAPNRPVPVAGDLPTVISANPTTVSASPSPVSASPQPSVVMPRLITFTPTIIGFDAPEIVNPLRGFYTWRTKNLVPIPTYDSYDRFEWSKLEVQNAAGEWVYDFSPIDQGAAQAQLEGKKFSFRIQALIPMQGRDVPGYLPNGVTCDDGTFVPDWNDPFFLERARALLQALGERFNGDSRIAYVDIGLYGSWGEWNMSGICEAAKATLQVNTETLYAIVDMHIAAFPATQLLMMTDNADALAYAMSLQTDIPVGWRRDSLGDAHFETGIADSAIKWQAIQDRWRNAPVVTEFIASSRDNDRIDFPSVPDQVRDFHVSLLSNGSIYPDERWDTLSPDQQAALLEAGRSSGYRYELRSLTVAEQVSAGQPLILATEWANVGVAPTYEAWNVAVQLRPAGTKDIAWQGISGLNLKQLLPLSEEGAPRSISDEWSLPAIIAPGVYDVVIVVQDQTDYRQPLALAIEGRQDDGSYIIGSITVNR